MFFPTLTSLAPNSFFFIITKEGRIDEVMESTKQNLSPLEVEGKATSQMNANPIGEMATYPFCPMNDDDMLNIIALFVSQCNWGGCFYRSPNTH